MLHLALALWGQTWQAGCLGKAARKLRSQVVPNLRDLEREIERLRLENENCAGEYPISGNRSWIWASRTPTSNGSSV
jgi:hypothetical protein